MNRIVRVWTIWHWREGNLLMWGLRDRAGEELEAGPGRKTSRVGRAQAGFWSLKRSRMMAWEGRHYRQGGETLGVKVKSVNGPRCSEDWGACTGGGGSVGVWGRMRKRRREKEGRDSTRCSRPLRSLNWKLPPSSMGQGERGGSLSSEFSS